MTSVAGTSQTYENAGNLTHTAAIHDGIAAYTLVFDRHNRLSEVKDDAGATRLAKFTLFP